jgi:hypothetical protein
MGKFKVWWDNKEKIGRVSIIGVVDLELTKKIIDGVIKNRIQMGKGKKIDWLIEVKNVKNAILSTQIRRTIAETMKTRTFGKVAVIGASTIIKLIVQFIMIASGKKNVRLFSTEKEALRWLKEKKQ